MTSYNTSDLHDSEHIYVSTSGELYIDGKVDDDDDDADSRTFASILFDAIQNNVIISIGPNIDQNTVIKIVSFLQSNKTVDLAANPIKIKFDPKLDPKLRKNILAAIHNTQDNLCRVSDPEAFKRDFLNRRLINDSEHPGQKKIDVKQNVELCKYVSECFTRVKSITHEDEEESSSSSSSSSTKKTPTAYYVPMRSQIATNDIDSASSESNENTPETPSKKGIREEAQLFRKFLFAEALYDEWPLLLNGDINLRQDAPNGSNKDVSEQLKKLPTNIQDFYERNASQYRSQSNIPDGIKQAQNIICKYITKELELLFGVELQEGIREARIDWLEKLLLKFKDKLQPNINTQLELIYQLIRGCQYDGKKFSDVKAAVLNVLFILQGLANDIKLEEEIDSNVDDCSFISNMYIDGVLSNKSWLIHPIIDLNIQGNFDYTNALYNADMITASPYIKALTINVPEGELNDEVIQHIIKSIQTLISGGEKILYGTFPNLQEIVINNIPQEKHTDIFNSLADYIKFMPAGLNITIQNKSGNNTAYHVEFDKDDNEIKRLIGNSDENDVIEATNATGPDVDLANDNKYIISKSLSDVIADQRQHNQYANRQYAVIQSCDKCLESFDQNITNITGLAVRLRGDLNDFKFVSPYKGKTADIQSSDIEYTALDKGQRTMLNHLLQANFLKLEELCIDLQEPYSSDLMLLDKWFEHLTTAAPMLKTLVITGVSHTVLDHMQLLYDKYRNKAPFNNTIISILSEPHQLNGNKHCKTMLRYDAAKPGVYGMCHLQCNTGANNHTEYDIYPSENIQPFYATQGLCKVTDDQYQITVEDSDTIHGNIDENGKVNNDNIVSWIFCIRHHGAEIFKDHPKLQIELKLNKENAYLLKELLACIPETVHVTLDLSQDNLYGPLRAEGRLLTNKHQYRSNANSKQETQALIDYVFSTEGVTWTQKHIEVVLPSCLQSSCLLYDYNSALVTKERFPHDTAIPTENNAYVLHTTSLNTICLQALSKLGMEKLGLAFSFSADDEQNSIVLPQLDKPIISDKQVNYTILSLTLDGITLNKKNGQALAQWIIQQYGDSIAGLKGITIQYNALSELSAIDEKSKIEFLEALGGLNKQNIVFTMNISSIGKEPVQTRYRIYRHDNQADIVALLNTNHRIIDDALNGKHKFYKINNADDANTTIDYKKNYWNCEVTDGLQVTDLNTIVNLCTSINRIAYSNNDEEDNRGVIKFAADFSAVLSIKDKDAQEIDKHLQQLLQSVFNYDTVVLDEPTTDKAISGLQYLCSHMTGKLFVDENKRLNGESLPRTVIVKLRHHQDLSGLLRLGSGLQNLKIEYTGNTDDLNDPDAVCESLISLLQDRQVYNFNKDYDGDRQAMYALSSVLAENGVLELALPEKMNSEKIVRLLHIYCNQFPKNTQIRIRQGDNIAYYYPYEHGLLKEDKNSDIQYHTIEFDSETVHYSLDKSIIQSLEKANWNTPLQLCIEDEDTLQWVMANLISGRIPLTNTNLILSEHFTVTKKNLPLVQQLLQVLDDSITQSSKSEVHLLLHCGIADNIQNDTSGLCNVLRSLGNLKCSAIDLEGTFAQALCGQIVEWNKLWQENEKDKFTNQPTKLVFNTGFVVIPSSILTANPDLMTYPILHNNKDYCTTINIKKADCTKEKLEKLFLQCNYDELNIILNPIDMTINELEQSLRSANFKKSGIFMILDPPSDYAWTVCTVDKDGELQFKLASLDGDEDKKQSLLFCGLLRAIVLANAQNAIKQEKKTKVIVQPSKDDSSGNGAPGSTVNIPVKYGGETPTLGTNKVIAVVEKLKLNLSPDVKKQWEEDPQLGTQQIVDHIVNQAEQDAVIEIFNNKSKFISIATDRDIAKLLEDVDDLSDGITEIEIAQSACSVNGPQIFLEKIDDNIVVKEQFKEMGSKYVPVDMKEKLVAVEAPIYQETSMYTKDPTTGKIKLQAIQKDTGYRSIVFDGLRIKEDGTINVVDINEARDKVLTDDMAAEGLVFFDLAGKAGFPAVTADTISNDIPEICFELKADHTIAIGLVFGKDYDHIQNYAVLKIGTGDKVEVDSSARSLDRRLLGKPDLQDFLETAVANCQESEFAQAFCFGEDKKPLASVKVPKMSSRKRMIP